MNTVKIAIGVLVASCLIGCEQEQKKPAEPVKAAAPAPVKPAAAPAVAVAPVSLDSIPTEEDFEENAAKEITAANLSEKLEGLEKEIQSEP
jgi:hypothetical protein